MAGSTYQRGQSGEVMASCKRAGGCCCVEELAPKLRSFEERERERGGVDVGLLGLRV